MTMKIPPMFFMVRPLYRRRCSWHFLAGISVIHHLILSSSIFFSSFIFLMMADTSLFNTLFSLLNMRAFCRGRNSPPIFMTSQWILMVWSMIGVSAKETREGVREWRWGQNWIINLPTSAYPSRELTLDLRTQWTAWSYPLGNFASTIWAQILVARSETG